MLRYPGATPGRIAGCAYFALAILTAAHTASAQTFDNDAAYRELLTKADPSEVVEFEGKRYIRAPSGNAKLPGGYSGAYERRRVTMPNGFVTEIVDPARPIRIVAGAKGAETIQVSERAAKIAAALEKVGVHTAATALPQAIDGYSLTATIGEEKPGGVQTRIFLHIGEDRKVRAMFEAARRMFSSFPDSLFQAQAYCTREWIGDIEQSTVIRGPEVLGGLSTPFGRVQYATGQAVATCYRNDVLLSVSVVKLDTISTEALLQGIRDVEARSSRSKARTRELTADVKTHVDASMNLLAGEIDKLDGRLGKPASPPSTVIAAKPEAQPPKPSAAADAKPSSADVKQAAFIKTSHQLLDAKRPPRTVIGPRIEKWIEEKSDWAADNPTKAGGKVMMVGGAAMIACAGFGAIASIWAAPGVALVAGGYYAFQSLKPKPPTPLEIAVREAREKLNKYQEDWKRGFKEGELNELGIYLDDLSKLTPEQRRQVYAGNDIQFTSLAESLRDMREHFAREEGGK